MIRNPRDCPFCGGQGFVCTGTGPSDVDACKTCATAAQADFEGRQRPPAAQIAMVLQFPERRAA